MKTNLLRVLPLIIFSFLLNFAHAQGYLQGRVAEKKGFLVDAPIIITGPTYEEILTDRDGSFRVKVLPGDYQLRIEMQGYQPIQKEISLQDNQTMTVNFDLIPTMIPTTQTITRVNGSILEAPGLVYVFSKEEIQQRGYNDLQSLLDDVPEVEIQKKSVSEFQDLIGIRGVTGNEKFLILMDGVRISAATGDPHTIHHNYPLHNAERVEVLIGAASAVYGVDAFSGVINIITQKGKDLQGTQAVFSYGNFNTFNTNLTTGYRKGNMAFTFSGSLYRSDEPDFPSFYPEEFAWYNEAFLPKGTLRTNIQTLDTTGFASIFEDRKFHMNSSAYALHAKFNIENFEIGFFQNGEMHSSSTGVLPQFTVYLPEAQIGTSIQSLYGRHLYTNADEKLTLSSTFSFNSFEMNEESAFINVFTGFSTGYKYQNGKSKRFEELLSYSISDKMSLTTGFSLEDITAIPKTGDLPQPYNRQIPPELQSFYYLGTNITNSKGEDLSIFQDIFHLQYQNIGGFAQINFKSNDAFLATFGVRYDYNTRYGSSVNPRMAIVIKSSQNIHLRIVYGEAFLSPSPWKAYSNFGSFAPQRDSIGNIIGLKIPFFHLPNPDLKPEKTRNIEGGCSWILNRNLLLAGDLFFNQLDNVINSFVQDTTQRTLKGIPINFAETPTNQDLTTIYGGSIGLNGTHTFRQNKMTYYFYYTFMNGSYNQNPLPFTARHTLRLGGSFSTALFSVSPRLLYRSPSYSTHQNEEGEFIKNKSFVTVSLVVRAKILNQKRLQIELSAAATNLLNSRIYHVPFSGAEGFELTPQDPARFTLGMAAKF